MVSEENARRLAAEENRFVGREPELDRINSLLLDSTKLITLVGSGGVGKTRLATEALRRYERTVHTPVHWVRLARVARGADVGAIVEEVTRSVVGADFSGQSARDALISTLNSTDAAGRNARRVLVLDNCEHVLAGVGQLIVDLLAAVPSLSILATSREAVGWVDEVVVVVPPLSQEQSLELFRRRAVLAGRPVLDSDVSVAHEICRRVHYYPLYIRLAAARLSRQPLAIIVRELSGSDDDKRMHWSHGLRVGTESRHQRVGDVIAWSYDLCEDKEQLLLDRMSVFAAGHDTNPDDEQDSVQVGADLDAIRSVCADDPAGHDRGSSQDGRGTWLAADDIEGLLERLADRSLVSVHITTTNVRYSLLESVRLFARQQLRRRSSGAADEPARLAARHRRYYREMVTQAVAGWHTPAGQDLLSWARAAWSNILDAIESSVTVPGEPVVGLEISTGLILLGIPFLEGSLREMRQCAERALHASRALNPQPTELQVRTMALTAWMALSQGHHDDAERILEECVHTCVADERVRRNWRHAPGTDLGLPAPVDFAWGLELAFAHRDARAVAVLARAGESFRRLGDRGGEAIAGQFEAVVACHLGPPEQALEIARRNLEHATAAGARWLQSWAELAWAVALTRVGRTAEALAVGREALAYQVAVGDHWGGMWAVHCRISSLAADAAACSVEEKERIRAATEIAQLAGGFATLRARLGVEFASLGIFADQVVGPTDFARDLIGPEAFATAEKRGALLRPERWEVHRLALGTLSLDRMPVDHPARKDEPSQWSELTVAEQEVAIMAAAGWTNPAIAARRGNSTRTVDSQMIAILRKLMIASRGDIIAFVPHDRMERVNAEAARRPHRASRRSSSYPR